MPVKFECPKCEKRFVEWGAQKLNFQCPTCAGEPLVRVGTADDRPVKRPSLRRRGRPDKVKVEEVLEVEAIEPELAEEEEPEEAEVEVLAEHVELVTKAVDEADEVIEIDDDDAELIDEEALPQDLEFVSEDEALGGGIDLDEKL